MKEQREFAPTIRQALTIILALRRGDIAPLLAAFPFVRDAISHQESLESGKMEQPKGVSSQGLNTALNALIARSEELTMGDTQLNALATKIAQQINTPLPRQMALTEPPTEDVEGIEIKSASAPRGVNASANLRIQAAQMMGNAWHILTPTDIEYGIRTGRIPANAAPQPTATRSVTVKPGRGKPKPMPDVVITNATTPPAPKPPGLKQIPGSQVVFAAPDYDELPELEF
ncbi:MAG: hypothetical protein K8I82_27445 [Anaerolineae bacterium]|nr:hypothetical protein [Anaerolineae bacterium]